uniref:Uncharacterized protein n=1 Tax=Arundo donax TaxID=35708 RepID=A0A0A9AN75_ARUDO
MHVCLDDAISPTVATKKLPRHVTLAYILLFN